MVYFKLSQLRGQKNLRNRRKFSKNCTLFAYLYIRNGNHYRNTYKL